MQLKYYLEQLSPSILKKIFEENSLTPNSNSPNELVETLANFLIKPENISIMYNHMTKKEKEVLSYFIYQIPNQIFYYRKLDKLRGTLKRDDFEYGMTKLRRKGILYTLRKTWGDIAYVIPENLFQAWHRFFFANILIKYDNNAVLEEHFMIKEKLKGNLEEDMYRLLSYIQLEEIPITQKGTIHKRHIAQIANYVQIEDEDILPFPCNKDKFYHDSPKSIKILLELAFTLDLVESLDLLTVTPKALKWHELDSKIRREYLEQLIRSLYKSSDLLNQHLFYLLFNLPFNSWFSFTSILKELSKTLNRPLGKEVIDRAEKEILVPLQAFGWIELTRGKENERLFRWYPKEKEETKQIYVQPDFEILVPQAFPYSLRQKIEQFAELQQTDQINRYLLTKNSVLKGLERGESIIDFLNLLEKYSAIPLSNNVKQTLNDWSKNYGTISFMDIRIMKCRSESLAKEIKQLPNINDWIIGEITPTHLIIKRDRFGGFVEKLHQFGYQPKKEIWSDENIKDSLEEDEDEEFEILRYKEYRVENIFPNF